MQYHSIIGKIVAFTLLHVPLVIGLKKLVTLLIEKKSYMYSVIIAKIEIKKNPNTLKNIFITNQHPFTLHNKL